MRRFFSSKPIGDPERSLSGRARVVMTELAPEAKFTLDVGCKVMKLGDIGVDLSPSANADAVADVRNLPFRDAEFERVLFLEVLEHLPAGSEEKAIRELTRVLAIDGDLILSTPHDTPLYTYTDPAYYLLGHRHYRRESVQRMLENAGLTVERALVRGGAWNLCFLLWYYLLTYTVGVNIPRWLFAKQNANYSVDTPRGYCLLLKARKSKAGQAKIAALGAQASAETAAQNLAGSSFTSGP